VPRHPATARGHLLVQLLAQVGETWHDGTAIHYVLWQERIVTSFGLWAREHLPFALWKALTRGTLVFEVGDAVRPALPVLRHWARGLAIVGLTAFHGGIALLINLGIFSPG